MPKYGKGLNNEIVQAINNGYKFNIDKIVNYLKKHKDNLDNLYSWDIPKDNDIHHLVNIKIINNQEKDLLLNKSPYDRNVELKLILEKAFKQNHNKEKLNNLCEWIIVNWGGIRGIKKENLYHRSLELIKQANNNNVKESAIASISKVLSFIDPSKYIIYDARVAYSINWILLKSNTGEKFFPIPESRNSKMRAFDINTLIHLKRSDLFKVEDIKDIDKNFISKRDKRIYINKTKAYPEMCKLIKAINDKLWIDDEEKRAYPFYTEMLLFSIADTYIIKDILETYSD